MVGRPEFWSPLYLVPRYFALVPRDLEKKSPPFLGPHLLSGQGHDSIWKDDISTVAFQGWRGGNGLVLL